MKKPKNIPHVATEEELKKWGLEEPPGVDLDYSFLIALSIGIITLYIMI